MQQVITWCFTPSQPLRLYQGDCVKCDMCASWFQWNKHSSKAVLCDLNLQMKEPYHLLFWSFFFFKSYKPQACTYTRIISLHKHYALSVNGSLFNKLIVLFPFRTKIKQRKPHIASEIGILYFLFLIYCKHSMQQFSDKHASVLEYINMYYTWILLVSIW